MRVWQQQRGRKLLQRRRLLRMQQLGSGDNKNDRIKSVIFI
jgi:hypothetical protein